MNKKGIHNILWALAYALWTAGSFLFVSVVLVDIPIYFFASQALYDWLKTPLGTLTLGAVVYVLSLLVVMAPFFIKRLPWIKIRAKLGLSKPFKRSMVPWALFIWGIYFISTALVTALLYSLPMHGLNLDQKQDIGFDTISGIWQYIAAFGLLVVVAPLFEELLFRGYLFGQMRTRSGFWLSALLTSLTFAVLHGQLNVGIDVFILSLFLCYLREKFDSIWPGVLVHAFKNGLAFILLFILPLYGINLLQ